MECDASSKDTDVHAPACLPSRGWPRGRPPIPSGSSAPQSVRRHSIRAGVSVRRHWIVLGRGTQQIDDATGNLAERTPGGIGRQTLNWHAIGRHGAKPHARSNFGGDPTGTATQRNATRRDRDATSTQRYSTPATQLERYLKQPGCSHRVSAVRPARPRGPNASDATGTQRLGPRTLNATTRLGTQTATQTAIGVQPDAIRAAPMTPTQLLQRTHWHRNAAPVLPTAAPRYAHLFSRGPTVFAFGAWGGSHPAPTRST